MAALHTPDLVVNDHRPLGWGTLHGKALVDSLRSLVDLAPDARPRVDHVAVSDCATLSLFTWQGTREGGAFEITKVPVGEIDGTGRYRRYDVYDLDQLDEARARFEAIGASTARDPLAALARPNAATAAMDRMQAAYEARDWAGVRAVFTADARIEDRRRHTLLSFDPDGWIAASQRDARVPNMRIERRLVGTAGRRVDLERTLWSGGPEGGRFEVEALWVIEVDEHGRITAWIGFDPDDLPAASREAWARLLANDPTAAAALKPIVELGEGVDRRDGALIRAFFSDDFVLEDHRRAGLGRLEGIEAYIDTLVALWKLAPDVRIHGLPVAYDRHGCILAARTFGTLAEGGAFENYYAMLYTVERGRITRTQFFEIEDVDAALARFAELRPDPLRIPPNAATRSWDRWDAANAAGDFGAVRALYDPDHRLDDRRRLMRMTVALDGTLSTERLIMEGGWRSRRTVLATAGDRLVLQRIVWTTGESGADSEIEVLEVDEVDRDGRFTVAVAFDPDDRRAASAELLERYARSDEVRWPPAMFEAFRAINDHDLDRFRATLADDFVFHDQRRTGVGRIEGADDYVASIRPLFEEAPDFFTDNLYFVAEERHGSLAVARTFGTLATGGEFESVFVRLVLSRDGLMVAMEQFEFEDLDIARARFEELGRATAA